MLNMKKHDLGLKYLIFLFIGTLVRFIRIFPNNDPVMGSMLGFAKRDNWWRPVLFAMLSMMLFDLITQRLGVWTIGTSLVYGLLALGFYFGFKKIKKMDLTKYVGASVIGVLIFDFLTGPVMSSIVFDVVFFRALVAQLPFTAFHLMSGVVFTVIFVPVIDPDVKPLFSPSKLLGKDEATL
jgi:hypothetical protein